MVEVLPDGILYFFTVALFAATVVVFFSSGEGVHPLSVILSIFFVVLGGGFVWLAIHDSFIPLP